ncbi:MAG: hypothetical protein DSO07_01015 [Thermoproteota archaeon]|nr:MAG: hypothetical protein DSO07_01015 [Candidatus Korarchaeota archaeon]
MINLCGVNTISQEPEQAISTTIGTGMYLIINIGGLSTTSLMNISLTSKSFRIDSEVITKLKETFSFLTRFVSISDLETIADLLSRPIILYSLSPLVNKTYEFLEIIGLHRGEHFQCEVSRWIDYEVEGWNYLQFKVTLLGAGRNELLERGIDKFTLLKNLTMIADQVLPYEVKQEIVILVE